MNKHIQVTRKVIDLIPYVNNSRTHSEEQINQVASSIKEFGFTNPILIDDDNGVIAGHGRLLASKKLNLDEVPCIILNGLTEAQKKAYVIADNQIALNSGWDFDTLKLELESIDELGLDMTITGFDLDDLAKMFDELEEVVPVEQQYSQSFSIIIDCEDEDQQEKIFNKLDTEGYKCRVQSL